MKVNKLILFYSVFLFSCTQLSQTEKDLRAVVNTSLSLENLDTVMHKGAEISLIKLKKMHNYLSVIHLQNGCQSCYPKFLEWHIKIDSLIVNNDYALLFIIEGEDYSNFLAEVHKIQHVEDKFYVVMDRDGKFLEQNKNIPLWIINNSVLINSDNKIKMIGEPWVNKNMTKLFYSIVRNEK